MKTYRDVLTEYWHRPQSKSAGAEGEPCTRGTVGLLQRRPVRATYLRYIGKEANLLEEVESWLVHD